MAITRDAGTRTPDPVAAEGGGADLGWALTTLLRAYVRAADDALTDLPGGARGYRLLAAAAQQDAPSQQALGESVGLDRTVVTYLLDALTGADLVERRPDPVDRRVRRVGLTAHGREQLAGYQARLQQVEQHVVGSLGEADAVLLRGLLGRAATGVRSSSPTTCGHVTELTGPGAAC